MRFPWGRLLLVAALVAGCLLLAACGGEEAEKVTTAEGKGRYENTEVGFAFDYPDDWEHAERPVTTEGEVGEAETLARVILAASVEETGALTGIMVRVDRADPKVVGERLEEGVEEALLDPMFTQMAGLMGGTVEEKGRAELGGQRARRYLLNFPLHGVPTTSEYIITLRGDQYFELNCQGERGNFQEVRAGCQVVFDSFEFTSQAEEAQPSPTAALLSPTAEQATATAEEPTTALAAGRIAFQSDRDGNDEIYVMNADGSALTRLTDNLADDFEPAWSPDSTRIAFHSNRDGMLNWEIYLMNADGSEQTNLTNNSALDGQAAWSPDGARIAFTSDRDGNDEIYVMNADGSGQTNLTNNPAGDADPDWSPDATRIAFTSDRDGNWEIYGMNADGSGQTRLTDNPAADWSPAWSPDGTRIAFHSTRDGNFDVYVMNADGSGQTRLTNNRATDAVPAWSPNGGRIAFHSTRDGNFDVYVMNADGSGQTRLTDNPAWDYAPAWSP